jgi:hypothetical protein
VATPTNDSERRAGPLCLAGPHPTIEIRPANQDDDGVPGPARHMRYRPLCAQTSLTVPQFQHQP